MEPQLRKSIESDLEIFFLNQTDEEAIQMAAFTPPNPHDKEAYLTKFRKLLNDGSINMQTILLEGEVIGSVSKFMMEGEAEITYAINKAHWGKGLMTKAFKKFLETEPARPIFGRVAHDNFGSQRVMEKAGFVRIGKDRGFANARGMEIEEFIYKLEE